MAISYAMQEATVHSCFVSRRWARTPGFQEVTPASTGWTSRPTRATSSSWKSSTTPSKRRRASAWNEPMPPYPTLCRRHSFGTLEPIKLFNCTNGLDFKFIQILGTFYSDYVFLFFFLHPRKIHGSVCSSNPPPTDASGVQKAHLVDDLFTYHLLEISVACWRYQSLARDINHLLRYQSLAGDINHLLEISITCSIECWFQITLNLVLHFLKCVTWNPSIDLKFELHLCFHLLIFTPSIMTSALSS